MLLFFFLPSGERYRKRIEPSPRLGIDSSPMEGAMNQTTLKRRTHANTLTCEELQVGEGLRQDPPTLFLHRQGDDHETVGQLGEVLNEVVVPWKEREKERKRISYISKYSILKESKGCVLQSGEQLKILNSVKTTPQTLTISFCNPVVSQLPASCIIQRQGFGGFTVFFFGLTQVILW